MSSLGILINSNRYEQDVVGLVNAAKRAGHEVKIFMMDDGVLIGESVCGKLPEGVEAAYCEHSAEPRNVGKIEGATSGSQYQNAVMVHDVDKVVVF